MAGFDISFKHSIRCELYIRTYSIINGHITGSTT